MQQGIKTTQILYTSKIEELNILNDDLKKEINKKHSTVSNQSKEKEYPCEKCNFTFESKTGYEKHLQGIQHNTVLSDSDNSSDEEQDDDDDSFRGKCYFCHKIFPSYDSLDDHQSNYIRCEKCVVCYHNEFEYEKHENCED